MNQTLGNTMLQNIRGVISIDKWILVSYNISLIDIL